MMVRGLSPAGVSLETVGFVPADHLGGGCSPGSLLHNEEERQSRKKSPEVVVMRRHQHG